MADCKEPVGRISCTSDELTRFNSDILAAAGDKSAIGLGHSAKEWMLAENLVNAVFQHLSPE
jgi:hypothetical protein